MVLLSCRKRRRKPVFTMVKNNGLRRASVLRIYGRIWIVETKQIHIDRFARDFGIVGEVHIYFISMEFSYKMTMPVWPISGIFNRGVDNFRRL
jgi:hypothetical protein